MDSGHQSKKGIRIFLRHILRKIASSSFTSLLCCGWDLREIWSDFLLIRTPSSKMPAKQRMRVANEKHSQNVLTRGNVPKSLVRVWNDHEASFTPFRKRRKSTSYWNMKRLILFAYFWRSLCIFLETTRGKVSSWTYSSWIIYFRRVWIRWAIEKSNIQSRTSRWW